MKSITRILIVIAFSLLSIFGASGETVTHKEAKEWAKTFFNAAFGEISEPVTMVYNGKDLTTRSLFTPFFTYTSPRGGFVIISGENKLMPILGYSLYETLDKDKLDPAIRELLREYARQIEVIRYDSAVSDKAVSSWQNKNRYINSVLTAPVQSGFSLPDREEVNTEFNFLLNELPNDDSLFSEIYTPDQWDEMVTDQLKKSGSAVLGVGRDAEYQPLDIVGRQGDYVKIRLENSRTAWNMRLFPSELYSFGIVGRLGGDPVWPEEVEEAPFAFHDEVMEMYPLYTRSEEALKAEMLSPSEPVVRGLGAGHFEIDYPSEILLIRVFNVSGMSVHAQTYGGKTRTAVVNIEDQPSGFYVIAAQTVEGPAKSLKVAR